MDISEAGWQIGEKLFVLPDEAQCSESAGGMIHPKDLCEAAQYLIAGEGLESIVNKLRRIMVRNLEDSE